jgi:hypothetical protein
MTILNHDNSHTLVTSISFNDKGLSEIIKCQDWSRGHGCLQSLKCLSNLYRPREVLMLKYLSQGLRKDAIDSHKLPIIACQA